jgi:hypothetical protein
MSADRYTNLVLTVIALTLVVIAVRPWIPDATPAAAQTEAAKYEVSVPKSWGKYLAYSNNNLLLEESDGSLRIVDVEGKAPDYPKVKVLIRWK